MEMECYECKKTIDKSNLYCPHCGKENVQLGNMIVGLLLHHWAPILAFVLGLMVMCSCCGFFYSLTAPTGG